MRLHGFTGCAAPDSRRAVMQKCPQIVHAKAPPVDHIRSGAVSARCLDLLPAAVAAEPCRVQLFKRAVARLQPAAEFGLRMLTVAEQAIQTNGYSTMREWFIAQFPLYRKNPLFYLTETPKIISGIDFAKQQTEAAEEKKNA